jgi:tyrosyl-tRNA synthetase
VPDVVVDARALRDGRVRLARLLALAFPKTVPSNKEGRRKIEQGGVKLDGVVVDDPDLELDADELDGRRLQLGKRHWARLRAG